MQRIIWKCKIWSAKLIRMGLRTVFHFDRWHLFTLTERNYAKDIITACNQRSNRQAIAEIGCGLADILRNVHYEKKYGYDSDVSVLKAAAFYNRITLGKKIRFSTFTFPDSVLAGRYDILIMVNWIHHIEPSLLQAKIREYLQENIADQGAVILDTVQDKEYKFNHDIGFLTAGLKVTVRKLGGYERQREIWIINKQ